MRIFWVYGDFSATLYIYIFLYIQPEDGCYEQHHVAVNYLQRELIKIVLDSICYYYLFIITVQGY